MLKKWTLGLILLSTSLYTQASLITESVNAVDMAGITVTATFADNNQETLTWAALSSTVGGVNNNAWSLTLDGDSFTQYDTINNETIGEWELTNISSVLDIVSLSINASIESFYFDISRDFIADYNGIFDEVTADYLDPSTESNLFGTLDLSWTNSLAVGESFAFATDTDKVEVPEPSTMFSFAIALIALTSLRKKSSGK
jgi:hypothetical protein